MGIVAEDVTRVREATDLVALVSQHLALKRVGTNWMGLCPFHGEKSPSFSVSPEKGFYHCFGCGKSGDAISFLMEQEHLDFVGAVEQLAAKVGITLRYDDRAQGEGRRERMKLVEVMEEAVEWYHQRLLTGPDAGPARSYLRNRGIDGDTARQYRIGWAPDDWDQLSRALSKHGKLLETTGLAFQNRRDRRQDFFRNRVLFPIFDAQGDPVSFGGRVMPGGDGPKYRNTSETPLYHKSRVLYGLNWAKADIVNADEVIVCEGYTDVIGFAAAGVPRAVATCGTALTEEHVTQLRKFARRVVLAFDPDSAGKAAADRVYAWERSHDIDVAVVELPEGDDPADLARRDPEALQAAVAGARPFLGYRVERVLGAGDLSSPEGRARTAEAALGVIAEHPSALVRDPYVMEVADRCRLEPERLRERLARGGFTVTVPGRRGSAGAEADDEGDAAEGTPRPRPRRRASAAETEALRLAVHRPGDVMSMLAATLFADPVHREAFAALQANGGDVHAAAEKVGPDGAELLASVAVDAGGAEPLDVVVRLVEQAGRRSLGDMERAARRAADPLVYAPAMSWLKLKLEELRDEPLRVLTDDEHLVSWLGQRDAEQA